MANDDFEKCGQNKCMETNMVPQSFCGTEINAI
jgi:hypothetical protein